MVSNSHEALINAAEGDTDGGLGYLYSTERLPPGHELNLLLVNTIRKASLLADQPLRSLLTFTQDLASQNPSHILLALHTMVKLPAPELVPAVTPILISSALLKHPEWVFQNESECAV